MTSNRTLAKQKTREKLLRAAERTFIEDNFGSSTLAVAKKAKMAHGTLFFHFPNRDELVREVVKRMVFRVTDKLYDAVRNQTTLQEVLDVHLGTFQKEWRLYRALCLGFPTFSKPVQETIISMFSGINYHLNQAFAKWADEPLIRTTFWQAALMYMALFGEHLFNSKKVSTSLQNQMIEFITNAKQGEDHEKSM